MAKRTAVVFGATGLVGKELIEQLCEREEYISVIAIGRNALPFSHKKLQQKIHTLDVLTESDVEYAQDVFCCLGTTMKKAGSKEQFEKVDFEYPLSIAALAKNKGVEHFLVITAMGSNEKSPAYYSRVKGRLEKELAKLELNKLSIIRPSLLVGHRAEFRLGERLAEVVLKVLNPLLIGPLKRFQSIEAKQVAIAMIAIALSNSSYAMRIYKSNELKKMKLPKMKEEQEQVVDKEAVFDWSKLEPKEVLDEEVVFDREKLKRAQLAEEEKNVTTKD